MRIDQPDGDTDGVAPTGDPGSAERLDVAGARDRAAPEPPGRQDPVHRVGLAVEHRDVVDAAYRAYAIDQAYEKVRDIEHGTVTPVMKRIESEDPERRLAGLENSLKGRDRLAEKVTTHLESNPELSYDQACAKVKDAIRYTFVYCDDRYKEGVQADIERLANGFERVDLRNLWPTAEYKGINTLGALRRAAKSSRSSSTRTQATRPSNSPTAHMKRFATPPPQERNARDCKSSSVRSRPTSQCHQMSATSGTTRRRMHCRRRSRTSP